MKRRILMPMTFSAFMVGPATSGTFEDTPIAPEHGVDVVTKRVAQESVDRSLFDNPYSSVVLGSVDVFEDFPYFDARYVQIVSDPGWSRLLYGEVGKSLRAFDGSGTPLGKLAEPHGLAIDAEGRIYVADTANDRVLVLGTEGSGPNIRLAPLYAITGLSRPYDVTVSDRGTPDDPSDDRLYVADTGKNRVVAFALEASQARVVGSIGELGSGSGRFAGPMAVTVGRRDGACTSEVFVADAHTRRIVCLRDNGSGLEWSREQSHDDHVVTSLETDNWGNVYSVAPGGVVRKYSPSLFPLAELRSASRPRSFAVPYLTIRDHRDGSVRRASDASGVLVEQWAQDSGLRLVSLGVEARDLTVSARGALTTEFVLTDPADVTLEVRNAVSGERVSQRHLGMLEAGPQSATFESKDFGGGLANGDYLLRASSTSRYENGSTDVTQVAFRMGEGGLALTPSQPLLLGNRPNPFNPTTEVQFLMPEGTSRDATLEVFDAQGRLVRGLEATGLTPGLHAFRWDGQDNAGRDVGAGVYLYRLQIADRTFEDRMVLVR
jgi:hypothetical protein